nr:hypothetical protein [uncultured Agathobaculum sp.]
MEKTLLGPFQVLLAATPLFGAACTQVGTWYKAAVPELGMRVIPVYIEGAQDLRISSGKVYFVRFSGVDVRFDAGGITAQYATADFIECVGIVEARESGDIWLRQRLGGKQKEGIESALSK